MNKYVPFLKAKQNEIFALKHLDASLFQFVTPFFDYPLDLKKTADQIKKSFKTKVKQYVTHLSEIEEFYFDNYDLDSDLQIDSKHNYEFFLNELKKLLVIPVAGIDRSQEHIDAIIKLKTSSLISSSILALRFSLSDFEDFESVETDLEDLLEPVIKLFDKIDLVFDTRICYQLDSNKVAKYIADFHDCFIKKYPSTEIRRVITTGSCIPASIRDLLSTGESKTITRNEMNIFEKLKRHQISNELVFGDYTIITPNYSDVDLSGGTLQNIMAAKLIYSYENKHFITRGKAIKTYGREQYFDLAAQICTQSFFRTASYSVGDRFLEDRSKRVPPASLPNMVVAPLINAHMTYMLRDAPL
ncbi:MULTISPECIES: beta family protein [unclassified Acinetobacter]|uniref:beta family protein n=1 Tax=unclassified Acinetobacter TaxID=196816 RepID=UPI0004D99BC7|nr:MULTISPECIES: beta family protein [unclassified Acinetobacter]KEC86328.1 hypothetical protein DT74_00335 [Acinetobacter sp. ETR1]WEE39005.1 beta family protein [Acinetobacter sp. TAC-1]